MIVEKHVFRTAGIFLVSFLSFSSLVYAQPRGDWNHHSRGHDYHGYRSIGFHRPFYPETVFEVYGSRGTFFYDDGVFYRREGVRYVMIDPPVGAVVRGIPGYYQKVIIEGILYYTADGVYYVRVHGGYQIVPSPVRVVPVTRFVSDGYGENKTKVAEGATLGGVLGAVLGGVIGYQTGHATEGALLGGAAGAVTGGVMGAQVPNEAAEIEPAMAPVLMRQETAPVSSVQSGEESSEGSFTLNLPRLKGNGYVSVVIKRSGTGFVGPQGEYYPEFPKVDQLQAMYAQ